MREGRGEPSESGGLRLELHTPDRGEAGKEKSEAREGSRGRERGDRGRMRAKVRTRTRAREWEREKASERERDRSIDGDDHSVWMPKARESPQEVGRHVDKDRHNSTWRPFDRDTLLPL